jgi:hypothetical protein
VRRARVPLPIGRAPLWWIALSLAGWKLVLLVIG